MRTIVIVFLGLMAVSDSSRRGPLRQPVSLPPNRIFSPEESNSTQVGIDTHLMNPLKRGGLDPDQFKRHVFILSEICPIKPRKLIFGDEIIVESQHPADHEYRTGVSCSTNFTRTGEDGGIILVLVDAHTADCGDYMRIDPMNDPTPLIFCGSSNETGTSVIYENENLQVTWHTELGSGKATKPGTGLRILLTAFQNDCKEDQPCFKCDNGLIINQFHMCNGWNNCGDWSDEKICPSANNSRCHHRYDYPRQGHGWLITMSVLFAAACLVAAVLGLMNYNMSRQRNGEPIASGAESRSFIPDFLRRMF